MPSPLVQTKLFHPRLRSGVVPRPRLRARNSLSQARLTLVSAPPGFGKTTFLAEWVEASKRSGRAVAWVSLEESEQQPTYFWSYVVTALDSVAPGIGTKTLPLLLGADPPIGTVLTVLVNELADLPGGIDLILDDYHLVDGPRITHDVARLVDHLPPQHRIVISTRADPALPLARLRARGELAEVRSADLRFTLDETAAYLNEVASLGLSDEDVATLEARTEGWIAALQLAGLSLRGRQDVAGFIHGFAGDDRHVVDYLVEEVLGRQPEDVRRFLLETSVLDRLNGSLCDAVTGRTGSRAVLAMLDRANMLIVPLDDARYWYRYHHLFADVLRAHLRAELPDRAADLHREASRWFGANHEPVPAVRHAIAAGDIERAADLVERSVIGLLRDRQEATVRRWIDDIPTAMVLQRPVLAVGFIGALMSSGELASVEQRIEDVERSLAERPAGMIVLEEAELLRLPGAIETYRAALALVAGDPTAAVAHADLAIARAAPDDNLTVAAASALSGLAWWGSGDLEAAHRGYSTAVDGLHRAGNYSDVLGCSITLGDIRMTQGRLGDAARTYEAALRLAAEHQPDTALRGTADMLLGLGRIAFERGDLDATDACFNRLDEIGEYNGLPQHPYRLRVGRALLLEARGDMAGALAQLEDAQRVYAGDFSPDVRPVAAQRARVLLASGRLPEALVWARERALAADDALSYVREYEHLTLARILIHQQGVELAQAIELLERLRLAAEEGGRQGSLIEILIVLALAHQARRGHHDITGATVLMEQALRIAEAEGYQRIFTGEGPAIAPLLADVARLHPGWRYPQHLLHALTPHGAPPTSTAQGLIDPLSPRELEVLRLLATDLSGPDIARELVVSLNTIRTHTKSIYAKLGVTSRRAAISRAGELGLSGSAR